MDRGERALFRQALGLLFQVRWRMAFCPFPKVLAWVRRQSPAPAERLLSDPERLAWMVESTGIAFPRLLKCLPRALAGFILLRRCGWEVTLKIGARRRHPSLPVEAHAWLEREGEVLLGKMFGLDGYAVFETFGGRFL
ncbi:MAG: lasso peptide biosynthesis B2 protein [Spirochaetales bacterium]|nr:lasso peptide biosynthesis B2 protein [Spirochaetales bacterium]